MIDGAVVQPLRLILPTIRCWSRSTRCKQRDGTAHRGLRHRALDGPVDLKGRKRRSAARADGRTSARLRARGDLCHCATALAARRRPVSEIPARWIARFGAHSNARRWRSAQAASGRRASERSASLAPGDAKPRQAAALPRRPPRRRPARMLSAARAAVRHRYWISTRHSTRGRRRMPRPPRRARPDRTCPAGAHGLPTHERAAVLSEIVEARTGGGFLEERDHGGGVVAAPRGSASRATAPVVGVARGPSRPGDRWRRIRAAGAARAPCRPSRARRERASRRARERAPWRVRRPAPTGSTLSSRPAIQSSRGSVRDEHLFAQRPVSRLFLLPARRRDGGVADLVTPRRARRAGAGAGGDAQEKSEARKRRERGAGIAPLAAPRCAALSRTGTCAAARSAVLVACA